ncbi:MAG: GntR family transcriptional regulator [Acidimicrobiales bacterium]|nr:GntR family transcriptional regulator [Acidimicrobiales bacterium]
MADRVIRYRQIASALRSRIEAGEFGAGRVLPSEAALGKEFEVSRVTVRKALEALRDEGLVASRQGFGWFVAVDPLRQSLGRLGTIEAQLAASDRVSERHVLGFAFVPTPAAVKRHLDVDTVLEVRRLNRADGQPFARVTVWCPEHLGAELSRAEVEASPFYELLDVPLGGASQTIGAQAASEADAELFDVPVGSPVLVCHRTTNDAAGQPVLVSEHVFPGHLTEFVVDLPHVAASMAPSGLRLVDPA